MPIDSASFSFKHRTSFRCSNFHSIPFEQRFFPMHEFSNVLACFHTEYDWIRWWLSRRCLADASIAAVDAFKMFLENGIWMVLCVDCGRLWFQYVRLRANVTITRRVLFWMLFTFSENLHRSVYTWEHYYIVSSAFSTFSSQFHTISIFLRSYSFIHLCFLLLSSPFVFFLFSLKATARITHHLVASTEAKLNWRWTANAKHNFTQTMCDTGNQQITIAF